MDEWQVGAKVEAVMGYYKGSRGTVTKIKSIQTRFQKQCGPALVYVEFQSHSRQFSAEPPKSAGFYGHEIVKVV